MTDLNTTTMMGRLVHDPMIKNNGSRSAFFTVACNRKFIGRDGTPQNETAFLPCRCYGQLTHALDDREKGDLVMVSGRLRTEDWNDPSAKRSPLVLVCKTIHCVETEKEGITLMHQWKNVERGLYKDLTTGIFYQRVRRGGVNGNKSLDTCRATYVKVRRSNGISDAQIAIEINHTSGVATLASVYGGIPPAWLTGAGPKMKWIPVNQLG